MPQLMHGQVIRFIRCWRSLERGSEGASGRVGEGATKRGGEEVKRRRGDEEESRRI
jgi:hypothetical protein